MDEREITRRLEAQEYRCVYPCAGDGQGGELKPGDELAVAYDNHGLIHQACASIGRVPGDAPEPAGELQRQRDTKSFDELAQTINRDPVRRGRVAEHKVAQLVDQVTALTAAIAEHRRAIEEVGPVGLERELTRNQLIIVAAKHAADQRLWSVVE